MPDCSAVPIHADHYRGMVFQPGDTIEQDGGHFFVIGSLPKRTFLVRAMATGEETARTLAPLGVSTARVVHRPAFFA
jgi:hypothetical protein